MREDKVGQQCEAATKDHGRAGAPTVRCAAAEMRADRAGQAEAQQDQRQPLWAKPGDGGQEGAELCIDCEGAGPGQHAGRQHRHKG
jgi:hypothetical protein